MKNKIWLSLLILPLITACEFVKQEVPRKPVVKKTIEQENEEILRNMKIEIPKVKYGEYKTKGETGETYSDPNRMQLGEPVEKVLDQISIEEN